MYLQDTLPLVYWLRTRQNRLSSLAFYFLVTWGMLAVFVMVNTDLRELATTITKLRLFPIVWIAYLALYELGYFMNDFWSNKREIARGFHPSRKIPELSNKSVLIAAIAVRILLLPIVLTYLWIVLGPSAVAVVLLVVFFSGGIFVVHNLIFHPYRIISTFFRIFSISRGTVKQQPTTGPT